MAKDNARSLALLAAVATKSAKIISVFKIFKFTKLLLTASTMMLSALLYGFAFGPWFAVGLISMLFVHEMGHVIALRQKGFPSPPPVFIPFLGAIIFAPKLGDRHTEAYIGYGGPLLGSLGAFLCLAAWMLTGSQLLALTAFIGLYINLFNMIPLQPLDGGRIGQAMGRGIAYFGMAVLILYTIAAREPALLLIWIFALQEVRLPLWWRPIAAVGLLIIMIGGFLMGMGEQTVWWIDALDVFASLFWIGVYLYLERDRVRSGWEGTTQDQRPYPSWRIRLSWLAAYSSLVAALWFGLWYVVSNLPRLAT